MKSLDVEGLGKASIFYIYIYYKISLSTKGLFFLKICVCINIRYAKLVMKETFWHHIFERRSACFMLLILLRLAAVMTIRLTLLPSKSGPLMNGNHYQLPSIHILYQKHFILHTSCPVITFCIRNILFFTLHRIL